MAQPTLVIQDANGVKQTVFTHSPNGQNTADNSQSVVLASDDPLVQKVATESTLSNIANKIPVKGSALKASSLPVTLATDDGLLSTVATESSLSGLSNKVATETTVAAISSTATTISNKVATETTVAAISGKVATDATLTTLSNKIPSVGQATKSASLPVTIASDQGLINVASIVGLGSMTLVPSGTANGTAIGVMPAAAVGLRIYLATNDSVTFTISSAAPSSPPARVFTISGSTTGPNWDENLSGGQMMYITAIVGTPQFRWI